MSTVNTGRFKNITKMLARLHIFIFFFQSLKRKFSHTGLNTFIMSHLEPCQVLKQNCHTKKSIEKTGFHEQKSWFYPENKSGTGRAINLAITSLLLRSTSSQIWHQCIFIFPFWYPQVLLVVFKNCVLIGFSQFKPGWEDNWSKSIFLDFEDHFSFHVLLLFYRTVFVTAEMQNCLCYSCE